MKARSSITRIRGERHLPHRLNKLALAASLLAVIFVFVIVITFLQADRMMRLERKPLANFTSNIMPDYNLANFSSLDGQTSLSGWFFPAKTTALSTIIFIHDNGANRLQFDLDTPPLFELLVNEGFNILAFDLRNSGKSDGQLSTYGYAEWADVVAAIQYARRFATTDNVVLYGIGSGVSAALMAWHELPGPDQDPDTISKSMRELSFDRSYIKAVILDTPAITPDEYIQADCRKQGIWGQVLLQHTVPYAIRLSAGHTGQVNLITLISQMQVPVLISCHEDDNQLENSAILPLIEERTRLHPDTTYSFVAEGKGSKTGWITDQDNYRQALLSFIDRFLR